MDHAPSQIACPSCTRPLSPRCCANCGEERVDGHSWSLSHFFHDAKHEFAHGDSKIFGTCWNLFWHPGFVTNLTFPLFPKLTIARIPFTFLTVLYLYLALWLYHESPWKTAGIVLLLRLALLAADIVALAIAVGGSLFWTAYSIAH